MNAPLLAVENLDVHYAVRHGEGRARKRGVVQAVTGVSFEVGAGETLGLVGESGCGKSTVGRAALMLNPPTAGTVTFDGRRLTEMNPRELRGVRRDMQMIFQDPYSSLTPHFTVADLIGEPIRVHKIRPRRQVLARVHELMELVGLNPEHSTRYPHQFSGGQRQRIGIARALAMEPKLIVCDEAVSALDVSVQAQVINLLQDLQQRLDLTYLFIAHGLSVVQHVSDRIAVMYLGKIVEIGDTDSISSSPLHPYTQALLSAAPIPDPTLERTRQRIILTGDIPTPLNPPSGCRFHTRCPLAISKCVTDVPELIEQAGAAPGHAVACHRAGEMLVDPEELWRNPTTSSASLETS